jgi:hypothetical protein
MILKFENSDNGRYYYIIKEKDFFNHDILTIIRGGRRHRIMRHYGYNCEIHIQREIKRLSKLRIRHGYVLVQ